jgi:hypothetical protein
MSTPHKTQPTEMMLVKAQQERERLLKINENQDARAYVEKFGRRNGWSSEDILEIIQALGVDQAPVPVFDVVALDF